MKPQKFYYAYGIIETPQSKTLDPIINETGQELFSIVYKDITLVASTVFDFSYTPTPENARSHSQVITRIHEKYNVIPLRFGMVFTEEKEAVQLLASGYEEIKKILSQIRNKIELGLKVIWKKECLAAELESRYMDLRQKKEEILALPPECTYHSAIHLGQLVETAVLELRDIYSEKIIEPLKEIAVDTRLNKILNERMILNAAFLVERDKETQFDARVNEIYEQFQDKLDFKYSGPWPPYNFVNIRLD